MEHNNRKHNLMKPKQLLLSLLALLASSNAAAQERTEYVERSEYDAKIDGIYYMFYDGDAYVVPQYYVYEKHYYDVAGELCCDEVACSGYSDYSGNVVIPESVTDDDGQTYPVKGIGDYAFSLSDITSVTIPNSVTTIQVCSFAGCEGLTSITIPNSVTSIGSHAFSGCTGVTAITIGNNVTSIGYWAFIGCTSLTSINVASGGNGKYDSRNNCNAIIETATNTLIRGCQNTVIPSTVTSIGYDAFHGCTGLTSVTIPEGVTSIGSSAFCNCSGLTSVTISNSVTSIGDRAFSGCSGLTSVTIPEGVTSIGYSAFSGCYFITDYFINSSTLTSSDNWGATLCDEETTDGLLIKNHSVVAHRPWVTSLTSITIPEGVTSIGSSAFSGCSNLTYVTIPNSVTRIYDCAFEDCSGLSSVTIPNSVIGIGSGAFSGCSNLNTVTIESNDIISRDYDYYLTKMVNIFGNQVQTYILGNAVTSIGNRAFEYCSGLTSINIPESVTSIGSSAFYECSGLTSIAIPESVTSIGSSAFYGTAWYNNQPNGLVYVGKVAYEYKGSMPANSSIVILDGTLEIAGGAFSYCSGLTSITIPESVISIGSSAFCDCSGLTSITIPNSVTNIGDDAFAYCSGLTSVTIPNGVTSICGGTFRDCTGLTSVTIPGSVTRIGSYSFQRCSSLTMVKVDINTPLSIDEYTFTNRANATLYVPSGSKGAYEAKSYWQDFKEIDEFIDGDVNGDEEVDVLDVVDIVRYTVGSPAETFVSILADINANGEVNVGDAVALVNEIAGEQNFVKPWRAPQQNSVAYDVLTLTSTDNGMSLCMKNERNYTAFQFDLYLPAGTDATDMLLNAQRKQGHLLIYNKVEEGHYRVATISTSNHTFSGYEGELLAVGLEGIASEDICLRNIRFFTTDGEEHRFDDIVMQSGTATDIASPQQPSNGEEAIYNLAGQRIQKMQKGINIVNGKKIAF